MCYVVMLKPEHGSVMTERVFMNEVKAKRYAKKMNKDDIMNGRGWYFVEKCYFEE